MSIQSDLDRKLTQVPGVTRRTQSRWAEGASYCIGSREIAHFHRDGSLDIRLTREVIRGLRADGALDERVQTRGPAADWVKLPIRGDSETALAISLLEAAARANQ